MKYLKTAPTHVISSVNEYFERELPKYHVVSVIRKHSETPNDNDENLYFVIAKGNNALNSGQFSCWTTWNQATKSLNGGHYWLTLKDCFELALEQCDNISNHGARPGVFITNEHDLLELSDDNSYSFVTARILSENRVRGYTLDDSDLLVLAVCDE